MIVGARDGGEMQPVSEDENFLLVSGCLCHSARATIRDLDGCQSDWPRVFIRREPENVARNREKKNRRNWPAIGFDPHSLKVGRGNPGSHRVRPEQYRVFVAVPQLDPWQKRDAVSRDWWVPFSCAERSLERPVVGDVRSIESGVPVPLPVPLCIKSCSPVMRRRCMAVKIHRDQIRIRQVQGGHRPLRYDNQPNNGYRPADAAQARNDDALRAESARTPQSADGRRRKQGHKAERKGCPVLGGGEQRKGVESVRHGRKDIIDEGSPEPRCDGRLRPHSVHEGRQ